MGRTPLDYEEIMVEEKFELGIAKVGGWMTFDFKIDGIPCTIEVLNFEYTPMYWGATMEDSRPAEGDIEYRVLDHRGNHAPWLEAKITPDEDDAIFNKALELHEEQQ